jgi:hypothetical protein
MIATKRPIPVAYGVRLVARLWLTSMRSRIARLWLIMRIRIARLLLWLLKTLRL